MKNGSVTGIVVCGIALYVLLIIATTRIDQNNLVAEIHTDTWGLEIKKQKKFDWDRVVIGISVYDNGALKFKTKDGKRWIYNGATLMEHK